MKKRLLSLMLMVITVTLPTTLLAQATAGDEAAEPYAVLTDSNTVLTFYYDGQKAARNGMSVGPFSSTTARGWHSARETITSVVFDDSFANYDALTSMNMWFYGLANLTAVTGVSNLNTSNVTSLRSTFTGCSSLTSLDLSSLNTSKVKEMNFMFDGCSSLTDLKVGFSTESVTTMANMFLGCSSLTTLDLSTFNTASVKSSMDYMFSSCSALTTIYVSDLWTTTNVTTGNEMFNACQNLVGGQGTTFSTSHRGLDYAHIDGGENNPGYLTDKDAKIWNVIGTINGNWDTDTEMTSTDGVNYTASFPYLSTGNYEFKIRANGSWDENYGEGGEPGGQNISVAVPEDNTGVVIMFNAQTKEITDSLLLPVYTVPGSFNNWILDGDAMIKGSDGIYALTIDNIPAGGASWRTDGAHEYKIAVNHSWDVNYGVDGELGGYNLSFNLLEGETSVTIYFNPVTHIATTDYPQQLEQVATPTISLDGDKLTMSTTTEGADIHYSVKEYSTVPSGEGTLASPYNVAALLKTLRNLSPDVVIASKSYVSGVVSHVSYEYDTTYGNASFFISDDGTRNNEFYGWRLRYLNGMRYDEGKRQVKVGDEVIIYCDSVVYYQGTTYETNPNRSTLYEYEQDINASHLYTFTTPEFDKLYEGPIAVPDNVIVRAKATKQGMNDSEMAMFSVGSEPYAVLSENNTKLTFYYDNNKISRNGMGVGPFTVYYNTETKSYYVEGREWENHAGDIITVEFASSFANCRTITNMAGWFFGNTKLQTINGLEYLNTSNVTSMGNMFHNCSGLTNLDVSSFNTVNVTDLGEMFYGCKKLTNIDVSGFNTANVLYISSMFRGCSSLTSLDLSGFNTSSVMYMASVFTNCSNLTTIYVGNAWSTAAVTDGADMFKDCTKLVGGAGTTYDADHTDYTYAHIDGGTANPGYFTDKNAAPVVDEDLKDDVYTVGESDFSTEFYTQFSKYYQIPQGGKWVSKFMLNLNPNDNRIYKNFVLLITNDEDRGAGQYKEYGAFRYDAVADSTRTNSQWGTSYVFPFQYTTSTLYLEPDENEMDPSVQKLGGLVTLTVDRSQPDAFIITMSNEQGVVKTYSQPYVLPNFNNDSTNTNIRCFITVENSQLEFKGSNIEPIGGYSAPVATVEPYAVLSEDSLTVTFYYDDQKTSRGGMDINNSILDNSNSPYGTATSAVFDVSFDAYRPTSTACWFENCSSLATINGIEYLHTDDVTNMSWMFECCFNLEELDLSNFNTSNVTEMYGMFLSCQGLKSLNVSSFNTSKVVGMNQMFCGLSNLTNLDLSNFDTSNVRWMYAMFADCPNLTSLDISSFNSALVSNMGDLFSNCVKLKTIYVGDGWATTGVEENGDRVFDNCPSLVGGMGTVYDANRTDYTYAHIDGGTANPGYLTDIADTAKVETVATPTFSFQYMYDSNLTIETETPGAEIYYTLNGRMLEGSDANFGYNTLKYSKWSVWGDNKQEAKTDYGGYDDSYCMIVTSKTDSLFESAQAGYKFSESLTKDGYYTIRFMARSKSGKGQLQFYCQNDTLENTRSAADTLAIGSEFADYEVTVKIDNDKTNQFVLNFGAVADTYYIDNVLFGPVISDTTNQLRTLYEQPIALQQSMTIKAVAVKEGMKDSEPIFWDYFHEGWWRILETYEYGKFICDKATGDPNVPLSMVVMTQMELDEMFYYHYEQRLEKRFDDEKLLAVAEEVRHYIAMIESMMRGFLVDGVYYHAVDSTQAEVIAPLSYYEKYKGALTIAKEVNFNDINFQVTKIADGAFANSRLTAIIWNPGFALSDDILATIDNPNLLIYVNDASMAPDRDNVIINGWAKNIVLTDTKEGNGNFYCPQAFTAEKVSYTREFLQETQVGVSRGWESLALPFTVQTITHEKQGEIAPFGNSTSTKHFWLRRLGNGGLTQATSIEANVPYIISMPNDSENYAEAFNLAGRVTFAAQEVTIPVTEPVTLALADSTIKMVPAFQSVVRSSDVWAINVGETRGQYFEGSVFERDYREVRPFEAYTVHTSDGSAPRFVPIREIGGATGIEDVRGLMYDGRGDSWYDLNGRRLLQKPTQKGVYMNNGRKVIIR